VQELALVHRPATCPDGQVRPLPGGSPVSVIANEPDASTRPAQPGHDVSGNVMVPSDANRIGATGLD
jgi:hypothetical protein